MEDVRAKPTRDLMLLRSPVEIPEPTRFTLHQPWQHTQIYLPPTPSTRIHYGGGIVWRSALDLNFLSPSFDIPFKVAPARALKWVAKSTIHDGTPVWEREPCRRVGTGLPRSEATIIMPLGPYAAKFACPDVRTPRALPCDGWGYTPHGPWPRPRLNERAVLRQFAHYDGDCVLPGDVMRLLASYFPKQG